ADLATLGFPASCAFEAGATGIEASCAALPVTSGGDFADCLMCWKGAELDDTSSVCSDLDCATPLPVQRNLGDTSENDCQKGIGKGGIKHLVSIEKVLEKCGLAGNDRATCLGDPVVQAGIDKSKLKLETLIKNKCGANRDPIPDPPFCC